MDRQKSKAFRIFQYIQLYGLISVLPHVKKIVGTALWEIRILGQDNIGILYIAVTREEILLLHGFLKKTQKTSSREMRIALERFEEWKTRNAKKK